MGKVYHDIGDKQSQEKKGEKEKKRGKSTNDS